MVKLPTFVFKNTKDVAHTEIVGVFQNDQGKAIISTGGVATLLRKTLKDTAFSGKPKTTQFVAFGGRGRSKHVLFVGLGKPSDDVARRAGAYAFSRLKGQSAKNALVDVDSFGPGTSRSKSSGSNKSDITHASLITAFVEGLTLSCYEYDQHRNKTKKKDESELGRIVFFSKQKKLRDDLMLAFTHAKAIWAAVKVTRDWSNEPPNFGHPKFFANESRKLAKEYGLQCKVMTDREIEKERMGMLLGVSRGSDEEARVVVLEYKPKGVPVKNQKTIALVGKGVTFDSGGISLKPSMRMEEMKHDMTGAATMMGATLLAAKMKVPHRIVTILGFVENMPSGKATTPGSVLKSRSGKTVEVINTDAEGRLVLGDLMDYVAQYKPDAMIDAATLTGAVGVALGKHCCAVLGNNQKLIDRLVTASDQTSERIWQLPLFPEYFEDMKSDIADMKNSVNNGLSGTIRAASFLEQFVKAGIPWAHLDIAFTAWDLGHIPYYPKKGASGAHVRMLARFLADF